MQKLSNLLYTITTEFSTIKKRHSVRAALVRKFYSFQEWHDLRVMPFPVPSVHSAGWTRSDHSRCGCSGGVFRCFYPEPRHRLPWPAHGPRKASIHPKPVDGFSRQRNCLPDFQYLANSALPSLYYLASRVQNAICEIARVVRIAVQYFASSVQNRTCAQFLHRLVGNTSQTQRSHFVWAARFHASTKTTIFEKWLSRFNVNLHFCDLSDFIPEAYRLFNIFRDIEKPYYSWYHRTARLDFHGDPDCDGSFSGPDHCWNRSDQKHITDSQWELGQFHKIMSRLLFWNCHT